MGKPVKGRVVLSRRAMLVGGAGLSIGWRVGASSVITPAEARSAPFEANTWVTIGTDGTISIASPAAEMGQGSSTALPLILAEELDADWDKVRVVAAPPIDALYGNPRFGRIMYTAGSNAVSGYYDALRILGAGARQVLLSNAARYWAVPLDELETEPSVVVHRLSSRRMSYGEIAAFAQHPTRPPEPRPERLKARSAFRLIGSDVLRTDLPGKVDGSAKYSIDVRLPGMLYGAIIRAPVEGDEPATVKDAAARSIGGVTDVVRLPYGVGVVAETPWAAFRARDALEVAWSREGKARGFNSDTAAAAYAEAARDTSRSGTEWDRTGDVKAALSHAAATIEAEYQCDYAYHAQMEPLNAVAAVSPDGSRAEIWCGTQSQTMATAAAAKALGIAPEHVILHSMLLGGGFGRRGHRDEEFIVDAVLLSQAVKRPVKVIWTREDDLRNGRFRPMSVHRLQAGLSAGGDLVAWEHRVAGDEIMPFQDPIRYEGWGRRDLIAILGTELKPYEVPHRSAEQLPQSSGVRTSSLRAIGFGPNKFATEAFLDEVARARGTDPVEFRLGLLKSSPRSRRVIEAAARRSGWGQARDGRGLGFAFVDYAGTQVAGVVEVSLDRSTGVIRAHNVWVAIDPGLAVQPDNIVAQTEGSVIYGLSLALMERITISDGVVQESNFYDYPVLRLADVPRIEVELVSSDAAPTGVGQMATPLIAPAVSNAVAALVGTRLRHTPMTPDRVLAAL